MCGEQGGEKFLMVAERGSPPACAGNSYPDRSGIANIKDHPRVCGEQLRIAQTATTEQGSPPRVRGTGNHGGV